MKFFNIVFIVFFIISGISCRKQTENNTDSNIPVNTIIVDTTRYTPERIYVGTIESGITTALGFSTGGYLQKIYVQEGDFVQKDQILASVDKQNAQNSYISAKASLEQAQDGYNRLKQVYDNGSLAEVKWVEIETKLAQAQSIEKIAKKTLNDCDLKSPFAGVVGKIAAETGMNLLPMQAAITLLNIDKVKVKFSIPENEIIYLHIGQIGEIKVSALGNGRFYGKISERGVNADALSHNYTAKIELPNSDHKLLPGMVCKVSIKQPHTTSGFKIPAHAVQTGTNGSFVWIVKNNKAYRRCVTTGDYVADGILITKGIKTGDQIITDGYLKLSEGTIVETQYQETKR